MPARGIQHVAMQSPRLLLSERSPRPSLFEHLQAPEPTLGELAKLKRDGGRSGKRPPQPSQRRREAGRSERPAPSDEGGDAAGKGADAAPRKKKARCGPSEASSKRQVPVFRKVFDTAERKIRDPRYDGIGEQADAKQVRERFRKRYDFVFDEDMPQERAEIRAALRKTKSTEKREKLQARLSRIDQTLAEDARRRKRGAFGSEIKVGRRARGGRGVVRLLRVGLGAATCGLLPYFCRCLLDPVTSPPCIFCRPRRSRRSRQGKSPTISKPRSRSGSAWRPSSLSSRKAASWTSFWKRGAKRSPQRITACSRSGGARPSSICEWMHLCRGWLESEGAGSSEPWQAHWGTSSILLNAF